MIKLGRRRQSLRVNIANRSHVETYWSHNRQATLNSRSGDTQGTVGGRSFDRLSVAARIENQLGVNECELLEYIARLPFIWVVALQNMLGYADGSDVYRRLRQLRSFGLIKMIQPVLRPGHNPQSMSPP